MPRTKSAELPKHKHLGISVPIEIYELTKHMPRELISRICASAIAVYCKAEQRKHNK